MKRKLLRVLAYSALALAAICAYCLYASQICTLAVRMEWRRASFLLALSDMFSVCLAAQAWMIHRIL